MKDTYNYRFFSADGEERHCGLTNDPDRREREHRRAFDEPDGELVVEGRKKTRRAAREWERAQRCSPYDDGSEGFGSSGSSAWPWLLGLGGLLLAGWMSNSSKRLEEGRRQ